MYQKSAVFILALQFLVSPAAPASCLGRILAGTATCVCLVAGTSGYYGIKSKHADRQETTAVAPVALSDDLDTDYEDVVVDHPSLVPDLALFLAGGVGTALSGYLLFRRSTFSRVADAFSTPVSGGIAAFRDELPTPANLLLLASSLGVFDRAAFELKIKALGITDDTARAAVGEASRAQQKAARQVFLALVDLAHRHNRSIKTNPDCKARYITWGEFFDVAGVRGVRAKLQPENTGLGSVQSAAK